MSLFEQPMYDAQERGPEADDVEDLGLPDRSQGGHRGQVRMAYRFAEAQRGRLLHVHGVGWHRWDGTRWKEDQDGEPTRAVLKVLRDALAESLRDPDLRVDVRKCEGATGVRGVLEIAGSLHPLAATVEQLDADPYLLNVANGTLDLRTLDLRPHDPADRITKVTVGAYRPDEAGRRWPEFLTEVLPDPEVRGFVQRVVGVALIGKVLEHVLPIWTGSGANGKGVTYGALLHALGDYAAAAEPELFTSRDGSHPTGQYDLRGRRFVVVSESDRDRRLAEATMKRLTGGDRIKARLMRRDFVEFTPSHLAVMVTNHLPRVAGDDEAIWRRMRVVPFSVVVPAERRDPRLGEALELEADAVLAWAVAGWQDYTGRGGLAEPDNVLVATQAYRVDNDAVARFLAECCHQGEQLRAGVTDLHQRWTTWAQQDGADALSAKAFGMALDRHGIAPSTVANGKRWRAGVALMADDDEQERYS